MKKNLLLFVLLFSFSLSSFAQNATKTIIENSLTRIGGKEKWKGIHTIKKEYKIFYEVGSDTVEMENILQLPHNSYFKNYIPSKDMYTYTGSNNLLTWDKSSKFGIRLDSTQTNISEIELGWLLVYLSENSEKCIQGKDTSINNILCYRLDIPSQKKTLLISKKDFLPMAKINKDDKYNYYSINLFENYQIVPKHSVLMPFTYYSYTITRFKEFKSKYTVKSVEINLKVNKSIFEPPQE